jgi:hypothetical protein
MIEYIKYQLKSLLPVEADAPVDRNDYQNSRKFITLSLKRSGQHAVINWLCSQAQEVVHFNHCYFERRNLGYWIAASTNRVIYYSGASKNDSGVQNRDKLIKYLSEIKSYKQLLYSFEDTDIEHKLLRKYVTKKKPTVVIIVRDPYNWLASTIKRKDCNYGQLLYKKNLLIKYLEQSLQIKDYLGHPFMSINYNKWVAEKEYRKEVCLSLAIPFSNTADNAIHEVPDFGGGSSFAEATPMFDNRVFRRWEEFSSDPLYQKVINDRYLVELTGSYFGIDCPFSLTNNQSSK